MPVYYRLVKERFASSAFDGVGSRLAGGRWNSKGTPVAYATSTASMAILENLVHLRAAAKLEGYVMCEISIDESLIEYPAMSDLPSEWTAKIPALESKEYGDEWYRSGASAGLVVPSRIHGFGGEHNLLINPDHGAFGECIGSVSVVPYTIDSRLI